MPDGVADDLAVGVLEDVADGLGGDAAVELAHVAAAGEHAPVEAAGRRDLGLGQAQKRGLARAGVAHEQAERALGDAQAAAVEHGARGGRGGAGGHGVAVGALGRGVGEAHALVDERGGRLPRRGRDCGVGIRHERDLQLISS